MQRTRTIPHHSTAAARLRALLAGADLVVAPGAYDAISARLIEQAGFPAVYMTGAGVSAARGYPDYGLLTQSEMTDTAAMIAGAIAVPLISDADTGYGNALNVTRTVRAFEAGGVAAIHIEDQVSPKRCGHLEGKEVVSRAEFVSKIRAAVAARRDADFIVIARTDARAVIGMEEAIARANLALDAGADMAFVGAVETAEEMAVVPRRVRGPCLLNIVPGGRTPNVSLGDAQAMGYRLAILPGAVLFEVIHAADQALLRLMQTREQAMPPAGATVASTFRRFGAAEWDALRQTYNTPDAL